MSYSRKYRIISARKEIEMLDIKGRAAALNRLIFLSYQEGQNKRIWTFAEIGKIHILTEIEDTVEVKSETIWRLWMR